jgi:hypothetical protein
MFEAAKILQTVISHPIRIGRFCEGTKSDSIQTPFSICPRNIDNYWLRVAISERCSIDFIRFAPLQILCDSMCHLYSFESCPPVRPQGEVKDLTLVDMFRTDRLISRTWRPIFRNMISWLATERFVFLCFDTKVLALEPRSF